MLPAVSLNCKLPALHLGGLSAFVIFSLSLSTGAEDVSATFSSPINSWKAPIQKLVVPGIFQLNENNYDAPGAV